jgi:serine/threonine-protein kinase
MTPDDRERWRRIEAICDAALRLDGAARETFLANACGADIDVRREVDALLAHEHTAEGFLGAAPGAVAASVLAGAGGNLAGVSLGDYEITGRLGEGGMGEVYRARDRKLGREVAIKVLSEAFAANPDRLKRFEREARLLATVNHPNIGAIYGLLEAGGLRGLVLELVEGHTLAAALDRGPLPLARALSIGAQIADALDHAHRRGITHRDLKPSNVMLTASGVKLLDFGIGKLTPGPGGERLTGASTLTNEGTIVGTLHYMAPEQLEGREADARSDLFAFGAVLYEMLTGKKAFDGPSQASIIAAVIEAPAPRLSGVGGTHAARLERIVNKCLAKNADERWQSARDLGDELRWLAEDLRGGTWAEAQAPAGSRLRVGAAAAGMLALGMLGWTATRWATTVGSADDSPVIRFTLQPPPGRAFSGTFDIAPDGQAIVFGAVGGGASAYLQRLSRGDAVPFPVLDRTSIVSFAPDGRFVASAARAGISATPLDGGTPEPVVTEDLGAPHFVSWAGSDAFFVASRGNPIRRASARGGVPADVTTLDRSREIDHHSPLLLPGGDVLLFVVHDDRNRFSIAAQSLVTGERTSVVTDGFDPRYSPTGHLVFGRGTRIMAAPFDRSRARTTGPPVTMIEGVETEARSGAGFFALAANGTLVYAAAGKRSGRRLVFIDRHGVESPVPVPAREFETPRVSPDGRRLAFVARENDRRDIWVYEIGTEHLSKLTTDHDNWAPLWSPDGRALLYASNRGDVSAVMRQSLDGSAAAMVGSSRNDLLPTAATADGRTIIVTEQPPTDDFSIARLTAGSSTTVPWLQGRELPRMAALSPDGRWLAYVGRSQIFVREYPDGPARQLTVEGGGQPVWRRDGRELYFRSGRRLFAVPIDPSGGLSWGKPVMLFEKHFVTFPAETSYDVAMDGRFVMVKPDPDDVVPRPLSVVVNWGRELRERIPTLPR